MISQKRKGAGCLLLVLLLLYAFTGCHAGSAGLGTEAEKAQSTEVAEGLTEDQAQVLDVKQEQFGKIGEAVSGIDVQNGKTVEDALRYTVTKADLFDSFTDAGLDIETEDMIEEEGLLQEDGSLAQGVKLLVLYVTVQNVRADPNQNITALRILCAESDFEGKKQASFYELYPSGPVWFSNPSGKRNEAGWKDYYHYNLSVGQRKDLKAAWLVDTNQYDPKMLYLTFDYDEDQKYIKLN